MPFFILDADGNRISGPHDMPKLQELATQRRITQNTPMETDRGQRGTAGQISGIPWPPPPVPPPPPPEKVHVPDYFIWSIITTICCCAPLGVIGVIFSVNSKNDLKTGNDEEALKKSKIAFRSVLIGCVLGLIVQVLYLVGALGTLFGGMEVLSNSEEQEIPNKPEIRRTIQR